VLRDFWASLAETGGALLFAFYLLLSIGAQSMHTAAGVMWITGTNSVDKNYNGVIFWG
jgi:hypothetical protein